MYILTHRVLQSGNSGEFITTQSDVILYETLEDLQKYGFEYIISQIIELNYCKEIFNNYRNYMGHVKYILKLCHDSYDRDDEPGDDRVSEILNKYLKDVYDAIKFYETVYEYRNEDEDIVKVNINKIEFNKHLSLPNIAI